MIRYPALPIPLQPVEKVPVVRFQTILDTTASLPQGCAAVVTPAQNPLAAPRSEFFNRLVTYATLQLYQADAVLYGLLSCLPVYIGVHLGMHFNRKASLPVFQYLVLVVVLLSSVNLIVRGLRIGG